MSKAVFSRCFCGQADAPVRTHTPGLQQGSSAVHGALLKGGGGEELFRLRKASLSCAARPGQRPQLRTGLFLSRGCGVAVP